MRYATILFFMLLSINVCTLYSAETSPDASQSHHVSPTDVVLTNNMMQRLYNGETISHNGNMEIKADNLEAFNKCISLHYSDSVKEHFYKPYSFYERNSRG